ncbi:MAG: baseplate J/gp47 family protein, partial [Myxococcota bacterium]
MTIFQLGQTYTPSGAAEITRDFLDDIELEARAAGYTDPPVAPGGDWDILGRALGAMAFLIYGNIRVAEDATSVLTATGDDLDDARESEGLPVVPAAPSRGSIDVQPSAIVVVPAGLQGTLPNGKRFQVLDSVTVAPEGNVVVPIITIDTGEDTRLAAGTEGLRLISPPVGLGARATVSTDDPLTGGTDGENNEQKRRRILNRRQNLPAGGNWAAVVEVGLSTSSAVQGVFVYPALGGPGSRKVVVTRDYDDLIDSYTREPSADLVRKVRGAIFDALPSETETVVQAVADETTDVTLQLTIPDSVGSGGSGLGWVDDAPWPPLNGQNSV